MSDDLESSMNPQPSPADRRADLKHQNSFSGHSEIVDWLRCLIQIAYIETAAYLRDRTALFWTFLYPIALLVLLMSLFGAGSPRVVIDIADGTGAGAAVVTALEQRVSRIEGVEVAFRHVRPDEQTPRGRVRIDIPADFALDTDRVSSIRVSLDGPPDASSGAMIALVGETVERINRVHSQAPEIVRLQYDIRNGQEGPQNSDSSAVYFIVGLAVLTVVSTALFGFTAPLIELRAAGGVKMISILPLRRSAFLAGFAVCRLVILTVFGLLFIVGGFALYADIPAIGLQGWLTTGVLLLTGSSAFLAAGLFLAGMTTKSSVAAAVINLINLPIMFLSDLFIPIAQLPDAVAALAEFNPVYWLVVAMRDAVTVGLTSWELATSAGWFLALTVIGLSLAALTFRWLPQP
ncbi:ABC transporter permease [Rhodocista pekingensis]|uniref:ABC transporter permease n=1 Tax=Rhodocista pekingensis TaxID=201185 RepID=A0ABW2KQV3_9PROT